MKSLSENFYPRSPRGERHPSVLLLPPLGLTFLSTLPAWGATNTFPDMRSETYISIHAPRVGSDQSDICNQGQRDSISIHAPRVGSDPCTIPTCAPRMRFLSTLPAWGATNTSSCFTRNTPISIHAPRVGSDAAPRRAQTQPLPFLSTLPAWGATTVYSGIVHLAVISIHAPRVGSDPSL